MLFMRNVFISLLGCLVLTSCSETAEQKIESYESRLAKISSTEEIEMECALLNTAAIELDNASSVVLKKNPPFRVSGKVNDKGDSVIQIWGKAFVGYGDKHWVSSGEERNIVVTNPKNKLNSENFYLGQHFFLGKESGKNAFGADVPVWIFGDPPPEVAETLEQVEEMNQKRMACKKRKFELASALKEVGSSTQEQGQNATGNSVPNR